MGTRFGFVIQKGFVAGAYNAIMKIFIYHHW